MTREEITKIRTAVITLSKLSDAEWEQIYEIIENNEKQKVIEIQTKPEEKIYKVTEIMHKIGIPIHRAGYDYLRVAVIIFMKLDKSHKILWTVDIYPAVAKEFNTTALNVERSINRAIEFALKKGNIEEINKIFGKVDKVVPNKAIKLIAEYVEMH